MSHLKCSIAGVYIFECAEKKFTSDGTKELATIRGSVSRKKGDGYENANVDIVVWEPESDHIIWTLEKGNRIKVEGTFWPGAYISKKDDKAKATLNVTADRIEIDEYNAKAATTSNDDSIPF